MENKRGSKPPRPKDIEDIHSVEAAIFEMSRPKFFMICSHHDIEQRINAFGKDEKFIKSLLTSHLVHFVSSTQMNMLICHLSKLYRYRAVHLSDTMININENLIDWFKTPGKLREEVQCKVKRMMLAGPTPVYRDAFFNKSTLDDEEKNDIKISNSLRL